MTIPSGYGSEVLRRQGIYDQGTSATNIDWAQTYQTGTGNGAGTITVPANVIITLLTVTWCNRNSTASTIDLTIATSVSGMNDKQILKSSPIGGHETFVFSDRLVLREGDVLVFDASADAIDVHLNYIYQDWTT